MTLSIAQAHRTPLRLQDLADLLPVEGPRSVGELQDWLTSRPEFGSLRDGIVVTDPHGGGPEDGRGARGLRFVREAEWVATHVMRPVAGLTTFLGISGSTAYGSPEPGDDLDFVAVVRRGGVWVFLAYAYMAARFLRPAGEDGPREWCFNLVVDEREARRTYGIPRGFLVAREALMVQPLVGGPYYRSLLQSAPWVREEVPRLYARAGAPERSPLPRERSAPWWVRAANLLLFPLLAAYLQAVALVENRRFRAQGKPERLFRIASRFGGLVVASARFDSLAEICRPADAGRAMAEGG